MEGQIRRTNGKLVYWILKILKVLPNVYFSYAKQHVSTVLHIIFGE